MFLRIENIPPVKLVGYKSEMNYANNKTAELWQRFMPRRNEVRSTNSGRFYSLQLYPTLTDFLNLTPETVFTKMAALEVSAFADAPTGMDTLETTGGLYAVFLHRGPSWEFAKTMNYIMNEWLPASEYEPDHREHFEVLADKYKRESYDSEEEIWFPIRSK